MSSDIRATVALTIAGSDSSGGAGIQADLKTFAAFGVYGASVITALTAQNTLGVQGVSVVHQEFVLKQLDSVLADLHVVAAKTGMLANSAIVRSVAARLESAPLIKLVVDPVMVATSGDVLLSADAIAVYRAELLPRATLLTPNIPEAARLLDTNEAIGIEQATAQAQALCALGCPAVLLKGGHGSGAEIIDVLCVHTHITYFRHPRIVTVNTHGTGCTLSAAITAALAKGSSLHNAVAIGIDFVSQAVASGSQIRVGAGHGPVDHLVAFRPDAARFVR